MAKDSRGLVRYLVAGLAVCALATSAPSYSAAGRTAGTFNVSNTGAATYSIPIFAPPGPGGLQPSVALVYNSNTQFGILGRGWSLAGFSSISSCNRTIAQDGYAGGHDPTQYSAVCLDGNRLRHVGGGSYGANNSIYMTEIADFSRIKLTNSYPDYYWTVERKDGLIYTYGGSSNSRSTSGLKVSEIRDRAGNKIKFTWKDEESFWVPGSTTLGTTHPKKIEWTQTSLGSGTYVNSIDFIYTTGGNAPASTQSGYIDGTKVEDSDLLTRITVSVGGAVKKNYVLQYENSPTTSAKRLERVTECSDDGSSPTNCLSPTVFTYQNGAAINTSTPVLSEPNVTAANGDYDFNGDGIKDIAYQISGTWYVRFGSVSSGYGSAVSTGLTGFNAGKLLGKPAAQLLAASGGTWYVYDWNGSSFSAINTGITVAASSARIVIADVNADGRDDLNYASTAVPAELGQWHMPGINIYARKNTSTGGSLSFASPTYRYWNWPLADVVLDGARPPDLPYDVEEYLYYGYGIFQAAHDVWLTKGGDFNRDGRQDLNLHITLHAGIFYPGYPVDYGSSDLTGEVEQVHTVIHESNGVVSVATTGDGFSSWLRADVIPADFNRDGCADINLLDYGIALSPCQWTPFEDTLPIPGTFGLGYGYLGAADWTGDGVDDYFAYGSGSYLDVYPAIGGSLGSATSTGLPNGCSPIRTDGNGDGLDDIGCIEGSTLNIYTHNGTLAMPDLLTDVEDGFGVRHEVVYTAIGRGSYVAGTSAVHPFQDVKTGHNVVSAVETSDGAGGTYVTTYSYAGALNHLEGRGFAGFAKVEAVDSRTGIKHERQFEQEFPKIGMLKLEKFYQPVAAGGQPIRSTTFTVSSATLDSTTNNQRYFPHVSAVTEDVYEVDGAKNGNLITSTTTTYTYDSADDDYGNLSSSTRVVTDKDSASDFVNQTWSHTTANDFSPNEANWCIGLPTASQVTYETSNFVVGTSTPESTVIRNKSFVPNYTYCRNDEEYIEPSGGNRYVKIAYFYDDFGNVDDVDVTGRENDGTTPMAVRNTHTEWGITGQFPISERDPLGKTTYRTFHPVFGSLLTETDPNGITVVNNPENYHDGFGRVLRSIRADGTYTEYDYSNCALACVGSLDRIIMTSTERAYGGGYIRDAKTHVDLFGRSWMTDAQNLAGGYNRQWRKFDLMGRVAFDGFPCDAASCSPTPVLPATTNAVAYVYDLLGRVIEEKRPRSGSLSTIVTTTFAYAGRTQTATDPSTLSSPTGSPQIKVIDVNGWMRQSKDVLNYYQKFSYDAAGSLMRVHHWNPDTPALEQIFTASYSYGIRALQQSISDMDLGGRDYYYNSLGELVSWEDANGNSFSQSFDKLSRIVERIEPDNVSCFKWGDSDASKNIGRLEATWIGYCASSSGSPYVESYAYDSMGRAQTQTITIGSDAYEIGYSYTNQGRLDVLTYPDDPFGSPVTARHCYAYGILQSVTSSSCGAGTIYWTTNSQNARGQTTNETLGNGVYTRRDFDVVTGQLNTKLSGASPTGTELQNQSYAYDEVGNVTQRQESNSPGLTENFDYDSMYRLTSSQVGSNTPITITYNDWGNITSRSDVNGGAGWAYHSTRKHAVSGIAAGGGFGALSYGYDDNGNMTERESATQNVYWTSYDYLESVTTPTESTGFEYGPNRQYYKQAYSGPAGNETTYYIGGLLERVQPGVGDDWRHYIQAEGQTVAIVSRSSAGTTVRYPLEDHQGSVSVLTNSSGGGLGRESFEAFGQARDGNDWDGGVPPGDQTIIEAISRRGYTGHSMLGRMDLIHMNGRVQDAKLGRFLSADPYVTDPGFTQGYNRYAYVNNNPVSFTDPSGFATAKHCEPNLKRDLLYEWFIDPEVQGRARYLSPTGRVFPGRPSGGVTFECGTITFEEIMEGANRVAEEVKAKRAAAEARKVIVVPQSQSWLDRGKNWLCSRNAVSFGFQVQFDLGVGGLGWQFSFGGSLTSHGQYVYQDQGGTMYGLDIGAAVSVSPQAGYIKSDPQPGWSDQETYVVQALAVDGSAGGGYSIQASKDGGQLGIEHGRVKFGPSKSWGKFVSAAAGKLQGRQYAGSGFCGGE